MLSLASLLNPAPPGSRSNPSTLPSPTASSPGTPYTNGSLINTLDQPTLSIPQTSIEPNSVFKSKPRGELNFLPHEDLDGRALEEVRKFNITSLGSIQERCAHIPYNSGKKDFFEKTGRESFEVFKYDFQVPGDDTLYTVMWDYNIGLVRITPFFKCFKYGKTVPAKMLGMNPGLKDITHSITGGAISAQGYWMPYNCARAVCATFCYNIAGALIPLFGPTFPSQCIPPGAPDFQRMIISPKIVDEAKAYAEVSRRAYLNRFTSMGITENDAGRMSERHHTRSTRDSHRRLRLNTSMSPLSTDTDSSHHSGPDSASSSGSGMNGPGYGYLPSLPRAPTSGWTAVNSVNGDFRQQPEKEYEANPWLSAVPRYAPVDNRPPMIQPSWVAKRHLDHDDTDYEGGGSRSASSPAMSFISEKLREEELDIDSSEKNAALMLMKLSAQGLEQAGFGSDQDDSDSHRGKRMRETPT